MRKRAEKFVKEVLGEDEEFKMFDVRVNEVEAELTAAVKEEREKWEGPARKGYRAILNAIEYIGGGVKDSLYTQLTEARDALAALLTEE